MNLGVLGRKIIGRNEGEGARKEGGRFLRKTALNKKSLRSDLYLGPFCGQTFPPPFAQTMLVLRQDCYGSKEHSKLR